VMVVFEHLSESKKIRTIFSSESTAIKLWYDSDQLQKVIYNLLANAYKFTGDGGQVTVNVKETSTNVVIEIADNGIGIAPEYLDKLFENYFQVDETKGQNTGYGVGLALSKGIVENLKGTLEVTSTQARDEKNGKTVFRIMLLKGMEHFDPEQIIQNVNQEPGTIASHNQLAENLPASERLSIVFAEDNADLRAFVSEALSWQYDIIGTENGKIAWEA
jgi:sensor histidine kinase regulating citrate/malate metabolism